MAKTCFCMKCREAYRLQYEMLVGMNMLHGPEPDTFFRYACELCGNKRCPHHSDHTLACTGSNEPGQPGSLL